MGKKYIIEIEDGKEGIILFQKGIVTVGLDLENESELKPLGIQSAIPYTEPDLEQVRCQAYEEGRNSLLIEVQKAGKNTIKLEDDEYYKRGLADAWEAARKISLAKIDGGFSWEFMNDIFGTDSSSKIYKTFTASEAIEKIRQYEQEQEMDGLRQNIQTIVDQCGYTLDEIAAVLEKMRGEQDG